MNAAVTHYTAVWLLTMCRVVIQWGPMSVTVSAASTLNPRISSVWVSGCHSDNIPAQSPKYTKDGMIC